MSFLAISSRGLCFTVVLLCAAAPAATVERRLGVMGTSLGLEVEATDRSTALGASERAVRALEATEARLSTWHEQGELVRLNAAGVGAPVMLSAVTAEELKAALRCAEQTFGAFDPTVGALVEAWGLRRTGRIPSEDELAQARRRTGYAGLRVEGGQALRQADVLVEEGGFGKGAGLDRAAWALGEAGAQSARLDLGGQVLSWNRESKETLAHPAGREVPAVHLQMAPGALATSGNSERGRVVEGRKVGHLLDPRTGRPAASFGSVTVWAPTALWADCLSTGLFVLGADQALAFARGRSDVEVLVLEDSGDNTLRARASAGLRGRVSPASAQVTIEFDDGGEK
jgi:FAD:protein FMN transferase